MIDVLIRMACNPWEDAIMITLLIFGYYKARAVLNNIQVIECPLTLAGDCFTMKVEKASTCFNDVPHLDTDTDACPDTKYVLGFQGFVVLDEAYIDFSDSTSALSILSAYANLLVSHYSFSKNLGSAGARLAYNFHF